MAQEIQSEDKKVYHITELEQIITTSEIWFDNLVLPKMEKSIDDKFKLYMVPLNRQYESINKRLFIKTVAVFLILAMVIFISVS